MGFRLSQDFRDFINLYGDGEINHEFCVFYPAGQRHFALSLTLLLDHAEELNSYGVFESYGDLPFAGYPAPGGLLQWGSTYNGDMICWLTEGDNPDDWPVVVVFRHIVDPSWRRFDGGMAEFLFSLVTSTFELSTALIGDPPGGARWTRHRDWEHDYGDPPTALYGSFYTEDGRPLFPHGRKLPCGALVPLQYREGSGGDQELYGRTGEVRTLVEPDSESPETTIKLAGGGLAPGMAYRVLASVAVGVDDVPGTVALELLCDGTPIPARSTSVDVEPGQTTRASATAEAEILVAANSSPVSVQLRIVSSPNNADITVEDLYLHVNGTLAAG
ncbi:SMI1/KNR4 family protein [Nocardia sp. NBC_01730]|nr:SMI1/KNR4 family protein [Nocardia sp. NBC_01730]